MDDLLLPNKKEIYTIKKDMELEPYQTKGIIGINGSKSIYSLMREGKKSILAVSVGGSGKTVMMAKIAYDYISNTNKDVAIFVHRRELLNHSRIELDDWYGIYSQKIESETKNIQQGIRVFVCMCETFDRRSDSEAFMKYFANVGLCMYDEAHLNNFQKIFKHFPNVTKIGWTATPISAKKDEPLKLFYDDIVVISKISELIELNSQKNNRGIVNCFGHDFTIDIEVDYKGVKVNRNGEYDEGSASEKFSGKKQIQNTLDAYEKHCKGQKTIIFNCDIKHSLKMHNELLYYGFNSQHIDSDTKSQYSSKAHREFIFGNGSGNGWLNNVEDAILCNVGIASIGTDVKSIRSVMINHPTKSFTKFWQEVFRANRAYVNSKNGFIKEFFTLIDTGNNILETGNGHGVYWDDANFDWEFKFHNPLSKNKKEGLAPIKSCPECGAINSAQARYCTAKIISPLDDEESECGYIFVSESKGNEIDEVKREMIRVSNVVNIKVDTDKNIEFFSEQGRQAGYMWHETIKQCCNVYKLNMEQSFGFNDEIVIEDKELQFIIDQCFNKCSELFKKLGKKKFPDFKKSVEENTIKKLKELGFSIN